MVKTYKPSGTDKGGWRVIIPSYAPRAQRYECSVLNDGTLIYTPVRPKAQETNHA